MAKEKMSIEKKTKLIYSGELIFFAIIFFVIATLELLGVIGRREIMMIIFNWVTLCGGTWMIVDFLWVLLSKKRRKKNSLLDKALMIPLGIYFIVFDILCITQNIHLDEAGMQLRRLMMSIAFYYIGAIYLFQGIYHYFVPVPAIIQAIEEANKAEDEKPIEGQTEEQSSEKEEPKEIEEKKEEPIE